MARELGDQSGGKFFDAGERGGVVLRCRESLLHQTIFFNKNLPFLSVVLAARFQFGCFRLLADFQIRVDERCALAARAVHPLLDERVAVQIRVPRELPEKPRPQIGEVGETPPRHLRENLLHTTRRVSLQVCRHVEDVVIRIHKVREVRVIPPDRHGREAQPVVELPHERLVIGDGRKRATEHPERETDGEIRRKLLLERLRQRPPDERRVFRHVIRHDIDGHLRKLILDCVRDLVRKIEIERRELTAVRLDERIAPLALAETAVVVRRDRKRRQTRLPLQILAHFRDERFRHVGMRRADMDARADKVAALAAVIPRVPRLLEARRGRRSLALRDDVAIGGGFAFHEAKPVPVGMRREMLVGIDEAALSGDGMVDVEKRIRAKMRRDGLFRDRLVESDLTAERRRDAARFTARLAERERRRVRDGTAARHGERRLLRNGRLIGRPEPTALPLQETIHAKDKPAIVRARDDEFLLALVFLDGERFARHLPRLVDCEPDRAETALFLFGDRKFRTRHLVEILRKLLRHATHDDGRLVARDDRRFRHPLLRNIKCVTWHHCHCHRDCK